ncbi:hypothetical protein ESCO_006001 [Escovopsis weberi]|uniref:Uncharacterized protein n=1 Tax=Escovopsis weberi TaxID=150374 RepID=A0A0M8N047_ESCWE|nr:hypothetical protein ESCO_006001 [Escovopsis weberi]
MSPNLISSAPSALPSRLVPRLSVIASALRHPTPRPRTRVQAARAYAAAPSQAPRRRPAPSEIFNLSNIPLSSFEAVIARNPDHGFSLKPSEYYACVQAFAQELQRGTDPWSLSSSKTIHATACILRQVHRPPSSDALATALWLFASDSTSHRASTLSLARHLILSRSFGKLPPLRRLEARFRQLVSTARDPDALTAEGELLFQQGSFAAAARVLARALQVASASSSDEPAFEWMPYCKLCLARAHLRQHPPRPADAEALLRELAAAGMPEAQEDLADLLRARGGGDGSDARAAEAFAYEAACAGRVGGFARLAEMSLERAAGARGGGGNGKGERERERKDSLRWAAEWSRLADPKAEF